MVVVVRIGTGAGGPATGRLDSIAIRLCTLTGAAENRAFVQILQQLPSRFNTILSRQFRNAITPCLQALSCFLTRLLFPISLWGRYLRKSNAERIDVDTITFFLDAIQLLPAAGNDLSTGRRA